MAQDDPDGPRPRDDVAGWGAFATTTATVLVGVTGGGWLRAGLVAALGGCTTGLLWGASRLSGRPVAPRPPRPRAAHRQEPRPVARTSVGGRSPDGNDVPGVSRSPGNGHHDA